MAKSCLIKIIIMRLCGTPAARAHRAAERASLILRTYLWTNSVSKVFHRTRSSATSSQYTSPSKCLTKMPTSSDQRLEGRRLECLPRQGTQCSNRCVQRLSAKRATWPAHLRLLRLSALTQSSTPAPSQCLPTSWVALTIHSVQSSWASCLRGWLRFRALWFRHGVSERFAPTFVASASVQLVFCSPV